MVEIIKKIIYKKTVSNGLWLYVLQFFNMVVPLLTLPYITRVFGSSIYGTFSIALNMISYLQVVVEYGFGMSATRKVAIYEKKELCKLFTTVLFGRGILLCICLILSAVYVLINKSNTQLVLSFIILLICLLGYCVQMNWIFQGMQEMKYISIVNVVGRLISTIMIFLFVKSADHLLTYSLLYSISPFLSGFIGLFIAKKKYSLKIIKVKLADIITELRDGFYVFTTQLSSKVFGAIGVTFLGMFASSSEVGIYSAIQKIPNILMLLWSPITQVLYPISSQHFKNDFSEGIEFVRKTERIFLPIFTVVAIFVALLGKYAVNILYGAEYAPFYYWLFPLLGWMVVAVANNFLGIQTLLGSGHDKEYGEAFQIGLCATISFNYILTKTLGGLGAALAPLLSEIVLHFLLKWKVTPFIKSKNS